MAKEQVLALALCPEERFERFYCKAFVLFLQVLFSYCNFRSAGVCVKLEINSFCFVLWILESLKRSQIVIKSLNLPRVAEMASPPLKEYLLALWCRLVAGRLLPS